MTAPRSGNPSTHSLSRRNFLALSGAVPAALVAQSLVNSTSTAAESGSASAAKKYPIGIELYSVRTELARDLPNTLRSVAKSGYDAVEFYAPYFSWTPPYAKEVRSRLDDLGLR